LAWLDLAFLGTPNAERGTPNVVLNFGDRTVDLD
jgi:hypothetical protein